MSTEPDRNLSRLYAALGDEAQRVPLESPELLRRRGDRRTRARTTFVTAAAVVLVASAVAGGSRLVGGDVKLVPAPPVITVPPEPTASPQATPSRTTPTSPVPSRSAATEGSNPAPAVVADDAFLSAADLHTQSGLSQPADRYLPSLCRGIIPDDGLLRRRTLAGYVNEPPAPADSVPAAQLTESIAVYESPAQAWRFIELLASRTASCPTEAIASGTMAYRQAPGVPRVGHDSYVIEQRIPATDFATGEPVGGTWTFYTAAVRHGDTVAVVYTHAYENWGLEDPDLIAGLMRSAYDRLAAWRGPMDDARGT